MSMIGLLIALLFGQAAATDQPGRIAGRITVEGANTPVAAARVILIPTARPIGPPGRPPQTTTDVDGRYQFTGVAPGGYRVEVQKTGFAPLMAVDLGLARSPIVQVAPGQSVDGVDCHLQKGGVIAGRILDAHGEPLPDISIMAMRRLKLPDVAGGPARLVPASVPGQQTNDLGEFRVAGLAAGEYYVLATPRPTMFGGGNAAGPRQAPTGRTTLGRSFYPGTTDEAAARPLDVAAGAEIGNIIFTMQSVPAFRVSGTVVDQDGNPVPNAMVMVIGDPPGSVGPVGSARTQENGQLDIDDVPPGSYRANASILNVWNNAGGIASVSGSVTASSFDVSLAANRPESIVVTDADVTGVRVPVHRPSRQ
jgi:hypothetical protein